MARNGLAGTKKGKSKTAKYYQSNSIARSKKLEYDKKYQKKPSRVKYQVELHKANTKIGRKGDGKDVSHTLKGKYVLEKQKSNRARNGSNGKTTKKK